MRERRNHIRVPVGVEGRYQLIKTLFAPRLGMTQDICLGGMQFACMERLEPGERISVDLTLPREGDLGVTGIVLWCRESQRVQGGYEAGLRWTTLDPPAQARLNAFLTAYTRAQSAVMTSGIVLTKEPILWPRTIGLGVALFSLLAIAASLWLSWYRTMLENRSLRYTVDSYQQQIQYHRDSR